MYSIHSCPEGRPSQAQCASRAEEATLVLHLRENRSPLSRDARITFTVLIGLFMAVAILPALRGQLLVPIFSLVTMAVLVGALEWHQRSQPSAEWLTFAPDRLRWSSQGSDPVDFPPTATRLEQHVSDGEDLRLFLVSRWQRIEIGRCLGLQEKQAIAALITRELGGRRA